MARNGNTRGSRTDGLIVALLGATFIVVGLLLTQAFVTVRSHERTIAATMEDFAGFAAEGLAAELNTTFSAVFLDQISASRAAHYAWLDGEASAELPTGDIGLPEGAILAHFTISEGQVVLRGGKVDADLEAWILSSILPHAQDVYPRPAPYALLRGVEAGDMRTVVYRRETAYEGESLYGFLVDFEALGPLYSRVLNDTPVLPRSLAEDYEPSELLSVHLLFPEAGVVVAARNGPRPERSVRAEAFAAKAGRMMVRVDIDADLASASLAGGYPARGLSTLIALSALTSTLLLVALVVMRRAARLTRLREDFVANVSHDLRTPLSQIRMFSETLLLGRLGDELERRRSLEIIRQQAVNLTDLVNNILHASGREDARIQPVPVDLGDLLGEVEAAMGPLARGQAVQVQSAVEGDATAVVDPGILRRVLMNLVDNAIKYGPRGQEVTVTLRNDGSNLDVVVDDQGTGIAPRDRKRVWDRFTRLRNGDDATTGTGLGLAVVKDLAVRHGGQVALTDAPGGGARITATLSLGPAA